MAEQLKNTYRPNPNQPAAAVAQDAAVAQPTQQAAPQPTQQAAPAEKATYVPAALTETGKGTVYQGREGKDILGETQQGLISLLDRDNPLMELERAKGRRYAESRGLGQSSFAGRAAEGAAIGAAMPLVTQAQSLATQERVAAQQATAQSQVQASQRRLSELQQQQALAAQSGDAAAARQLSRDVALETNKLQQTMLNQRIASEEGLQARQLESGERLQTDLQTQRIDAEKSIQQQDLVVREQMQQREIDARAVESDLSRKLQETMQDKDVDYKKWLEESTFQHQQILQTSPLAVDTLRSFGNDAASILNNPETSSKQKNAALAALRENLAGGMRLIEGVSNVDLTKYLPGLVKATSKTATGTGTALATIPKHRGPKMPWNLDFPGLY